MRHLETAANSGFGDVVTLLLEWGAAADPTCLVHVHRSSPEVVDILCAYGADPNAELSHPHISPLHAAAGDAEAVNILSYLISNGANVNEDHGWHTPLEVAAECSNPGAMSLLLQNGAMVTPAAMSLCTDYQCMRLLDMDLD